MASLRELAARVDRLRQRIPPRVARRAAERAAQEAARATAELAAKRDAIEALSKILFDYRSNGEDPWEIVDPWDIVWGIQSRLESGGAAEDEAFLEALPADVLQAAGLTAVGFIEATARGFDQQFRTRARAVVSP